MASSPDIPDIPLIDFGPFLHGSTRDREVVAASIDAGLCSTGFIYLRNHGIDLHRVDECLNWSRRLFALPESEKKLTQPLPNRSHHRGYSGVGNEKVREHVCMKEGFSCGNLTDEEQPNIWPSENILPGFRQFMEGFFEYVRNLILLLGLHETYAPPPGVSNHSFEIVINGLIFHIPFSIYHAKSLFNLELLHYPALSRQLLRSGKLTRIPAHSDFGTLTLLFQDSTGGLEIADLGSASTEKSAEFEKLGKFRHIKPREDTVIVNVGYLLMRWSNGRWKNTIHRVVEPPILSQGADINNSSENDGNAGILDDICPSRYSIPFSSAPDLETIVEALPGCWSDEIPKKWGPINAGKYLRRKRGDVYT